jgi:hypothetical protein
MSVEFLGPVLYNSEAAQKLKDDFVVDVAY